MNNSTNLAERARFGTFELNVRTGELVSIGTAPPEAGFVKALLREQPFQILRILVELQGKIVTRQEIRQILWPDDTVVEFDRSINVAMAIPLRKALADDADRPKYIETLARRGYRLIAPVKWHESSTAAQGLPEPKTDTVPRIEGQVGEREPRAPKYSRRAAVLGASAVILVVVGYMSWRRSRDVTSPRSEKVMLAVLPFENLTGDPNKEYLADEVPGLTKAQNSIQIGVLIAVSIVTVWTLYMVPSWQVPGVSRQCLIS
jgi:DNA-binding winged helix-turn-helix (wHTH) protein